MRFASVHVIDFPSFAAALRWRTRAKPTGLHWLKAMTPIGSAATAGFGAGLPRLRRQLVVASWADEAALEATSAMPGSATALLAPYRARGSFRGAVPFDPAAESPASGPVAVLTLGRARWRRAPRFAYEGAKLEHSILRAPGLIAAASAGFPPTGNATFSVWEREEDMLAFAYGGEAPHRATVHTDRRLGILGEQMTVRFRVLELRGGWDKLAASCLPRPATTPGPRSSAPRSS